ncbi:CCA tRNA nucleotidyltransferase [Clostridium sp. JN-1]|jgi:tRNA nucleotidyltransferase (CCA-adding enzyme)|uniref:CCA tRNA nucleotidyltransferase n=1 Tax=Clostridium sp. JN-1 TaxID=2483110 RepID=UPI000F0B502D|nr:CCA tRNA nucleotidyltransferase [Clostridium sp. JN-1]
MKDILINFDKDQVDVINCLKDICIRDSIKAYLVGGTLRDLILARKINDIDICLNEDPKKLVRYIKGIKEYKYYDKFQTASLIFDNGISLNLIRCRKEIYEQNGQLPIIIPSDIYDDLYRRDFTINAIAYDIVKNSIIDVFGGIDDLYNGELKKVHENSYEEDPTRIFRGIRYSVRYYLKICDAAEIKKCIENGVFNTVNSDKIVGELYAMCREEKWISNFVTCSWLKIFDLNLNYLGIPNIVKSYSYNNINIRILNLFFCMKCFKFKQILMENSILDKRLKKSMKYYYNNKMTELFYKDMDNYEIYKRLNNLDKYLLVLMGWDEGTKYRILNYVKNLKDIKLNMDNEYLKSIGIQDDKVIGKILDYMLKIKLDVGIVNETKYLIENLGEIKDVFKY